MSVTDVFIPPGLKNSMFKEFMKKRKVNLVLLGHVGRLFNSETVRKWNSSFFEITVSKKLSLPLPNDNRDTLDVEYTKEDARCLLQDIKGEIVIGVMSYPFDDNFYLHRVGENKVCISTANVDSILRSADISIENFIIKNIYEIILLYELFRNVKSSDVDRFPHRDTRNCLCDLNGDLNHVVYNTESPILCEECLSKIQRKSLPDGWITQFQKELRSIKKPYLIQVKLWVKINPFWTTVGSIIISLLLGSLISHFIK